MGQRGDSKLIWNPRDEDETEAARKHFKNLVGKRFAAFRVKRDGDQGERVHEFDADAAKLIMVPPMAGGR
jgi:hypothetical protein